MKDEKKDQILGAIYTSSIISIELLNPNSSPYQLVDCKLMLVQYFLCKYFTIA